MRCQVAGVHRGGFQATEHRYEGRNTLASPSRRLGSRPATGGERTTEQPDRYRLWGQFRLPDGDVITVPFTVEAT
jgi:P-type Cu+ transporter